MNYEINYEEKKINELIKKYKTATPGTWGVRDGIMVKLKL